MARSKEETAPPINKKLNVPLNAAGEIDWEGMRPSVRSRLLAVAPDIAGKAIADAGDGEYTPDAVGDDAPDVPGDITEDNVRTALDILSQANGLVFRMGIARFMKHPLARTRDGKQIPMQLDMDIVVKSFSLTDKQHKELDPRALRQAKKYMPEALKKNVDVWMLVAMWLKFTADNGKNALEAQVRRDLDKAKAQQAAVAPPSIRMLDRSHRTAMTCNRQLEWTKGKH